MQAADSGQRRRRLDLSDFPIAQPSGVAVPTSGSSRLRFALIGIDFLAVLTAWLPVYLRHTHGPTLLSIHSGELAMATASLAAVIIVGSKGLYRARVCAARAVEISRLWRVAVLSALVDLAADKLFGLEPRIDIAVLRGLLTFVLLVLFRTVYRAILRGLRRKGGLTRPIVIVGANEAALEMHRGLAQHPEFGFRSCGVLGERHDSLADAEMPWLGGYGDLLEVVKAYSATGVIVVTSAPSQHELNQIVRTLLRAGIHIHLSSGLQGIAWHRIQASPIGYEPLMYLEPVSLSGWQMAVKRVVDIIGCAFMLAAAMPVLIAAAVAIKLDTSGPVLFRQKRVGRDGKLFTMYKLRTMVPDAEARLADLGSHNVRTGPLFKMAADPRVTKVGRFLRGTSIDELPQLINVLSGKMSLVGPRPALPEEVAQFSPDLLTRLHVQPGVTGLWQVEARDDPSFERYQRLDLYYVENWTVMLDLAVMLSTTLAIVRRAVRMVRPRSQPADVELDASGKAVLPSEELVLD